MYMYIYECMNMISMCANCYYILFMFLLLRILMNSHSHNLHARKSWNHTVYKFVIRLWELCAKFNCWKMESTPSSLHHFVVGYISILNWVILKLTLSRLNGAVCVWLLQLPNIYNNTSLCIRFQYQSHFHAKTNTSMHILLYTYTILYIYIYIHNIHLCGVHIVIVYTHTHTPSSLLVFNS